MSNSDLNDSLDDLIGARSTVERPVQSRPAPPDFVENRTFVEGCPKCRGTGRTPWGTCFKCKGAGKRTFKTSAADRSSNRASAANRKANAEVEALSAFEAAHPAVGVWIKANAGKFDFATKMVEAIVRFGSLTEGQLAACQRCVDREAAKTAARAEAIQSAPQIDTAGIDRLMASFDKARAHAASKGTGVTLRNPKITIGGMTISPAKATSANAGALYVKQAGDYLGKIMGGKFLSTSFCTPAQRDQVLAFVADPAQAAKAYGQETGICCACNATLTSKWRLRGIGPICAEKMGWAGLSEDKVLSDDCEDI